MSLAHDVATKLRTNDVQIDEQICFAEMLLSDALLDGLTKAGFKRPSPIQLKALPLGRCGLDLIVQAKSGTGKTCVFTVIALDGIDVTSISSQVLILAPTREIAIQIADAVNTIGASIKGLTTHTFIGGTPVSDDKVRAKKCHVVVGTPGRVKQLIELGAIETNSLRLFVLDEADKLLEGDFVEPINWIYSTLPENKQILALSATYPEYLANQLTNYMRNPTFIRLNISDPALIGIKQYHHVVPSHQLPNKVFDFKRDVVLNILSCVEFQQCLIFFNQQTRAEGLQVDLEANGWPTVCIAGSLDQKERNFAMEQLKNYRCRILISTDLTSRGIDADKVNLVINLDVPRDHETYLHRIGRAGRFGSYGAAVSIVSRGGQDKDLWAVEAKCHTSIAKLPDPIPKDLVSKKIPVKLSDVVTTERIMTHPQIPSETLLCQASQQETLYQTHEGGSAQLENSIPQQDDSQTHRLDSNYFVNKHNILTNEFLPENDSTTGHVSDSQLEKDMEEEKVENETVEKETATIDFKKQNGRELLCSSSDKENLRESHLSEEFNDVLTVEHCVSYRSGENSVRVNFSTNNNIFSSCSNANGLLDCKTEEEGFYQSHPSFLDCREDVFENSASEQEQQLINVKQEDVFVDHSSISSENRNSNHASHLYEVSTESCKSPIREQSPTLSLHDGSFLIVKDNDFSTKHTCTFSSSLSSENQSSDSVKLCNSNNLEHLGVVDALRHDKRCVSNSANDKDIPVLNVGEKQMSDSDKEKTITNADKNSDPSSHNLNNKIKSQHKGQRRKPFFKPMSMFHFIGEIQEEKDHNAKDHDEIGKLSSSQRNNLDLQDCELMPDDHVRRDAKSNIKFQSSEQEIETQNNLQALQNNIKLADKDNCPLVEKNSNIDKSDNTFATMKIHIPQSNGSAHSISEKPPKTSDIFVPSNISETGIELSLENEMNYSLLSNNSVQKITSKDESSVKDDIVIFSPESHIKHQGDRLKMKDISLVLEKHELKIEMKAGSPSFGFHHLSNHESREQDILSSINSLIVPSLINLEKCDIDTIHKNFQDHYNSKAKWKIDVDDRSLKKTSKVPVISLSNQSIQLLDQFNKCEFDALFDMKRELNEKVLKAREERIQNPSLLSDLYEKESPREVDESERCAPNMAQTSDRKKIKARRRNRAKVRTRDRHSPENWRAAPREDDDSIEKQSYSQSNNISRKNSKTSTIKSSPSELTSYNGTQVHGSSMSKMRQNDLDETSAKGTNHLKEKQSDILQSNQDAIGSIPSYRRGQATPKVHENCLPEKEKERVSRRQNDSKDTIFDHQYDTLDKAHQDLVMKRKNKKKPADESNGTRSNPTPLLKGKESHDETTPVYKETAPPPSVISYDDLDTFASNTSAVDKHFERENLNIPILKGPAMPHVISYDDLDTFASNTSTHDKYFEQNNCSPNFSNDVHSQNNSDKVTTNHNRLDSDALHNTSEATVSSFKSSTNNGNAFKKIFNKVASSEEQFSEHRRLDNFVSGELQIKPMEKIDRPTSVHIMDKENDKGSEEKRNVIRGCQKQTLSKSNSKNKKISSLPSTFSKTPIKDHFDESNSSRKRIPKHKPVFESNHKPSTSDFAKEPTHFNANGRGKNNNPSRSKCRKSSTDSDEDEAFSEGDSNCSGDGNDANESVQPNFRPMHTQQRGNQYFHDSPKYDLDYTHQCSGIDYNNYRHAYSGYGHPHLSSHLPPLPLFSPAIPHYLHPTPTSNHHSNNYPLHSHYYRLHHDHLTNPHSHPNKHFYNYHPPSYSHQPSANLHAYSPYPYSNADQHLRNTNAGQASELYYSHCHHYPPPFQQQWWQRQSPLHHHHSSADSAQHPLVSANEHLYEYCSRLASIASQYKSYLKHMSSVCMTLLEKN